MNKIRIFLPLALALLLLHPLTGQNWTKLKKQGDELAKEGFYLEAGEAYYKAWKEKPEKLDLANQAGNTFLLIKEYRQAAESLKPVAHWNQPDKMNGLKYARALKQSGDHTGAIAAFEAFRRDYEGPDKALQQQIADREIAGCRLAMEKPAERSPFIVSYPGKGINSDAPDFAPALFGEDVVYFSSTRSGMSRLYRSQFQSGKWGKPDSPRSLPSHEGFHVANGSFSSDGQRFYYTVCRQPNDARKQRARCEIHVLNRRGNGWSPSERLPDYINLREANQTHPASVDIDGTEYLFFATDRPGGQGGMDIWYCSRQSGSKELDFTFPEPLGPEVNTPDDDQTPYYDRHAQYLYFSSNGRIALGGMDIYRVAGMPGAWGKTEHPGRPLNSEADDIYFRMNSEGQAGFLVSNREVPAVREHTRVEDLFHVSTQVPDLLVRGQVFDKMSEQTLKGVRVSLYHMNNGEQTVFNTVFTENGSFQFTVPGTMDVYIRAEKPEYEPSILRVRPAEAEGRELVHHFYLITETMPDEIPALAAQAPTPVTKQETPAPAQPQNETPLAAAQPLPSTEPKPEDSVAEPVVADREKTVPVRKIGDLQPYQNKIRLQEKSGETPASRRSEEAMANALAGRPTSPQRAPSAPERTSSVGTSLPTIPLVEADADAFTGEGLDRRYKGKRVDKRKPDSEAQAFEGIYYRVQLEATDRPRPGTDRYAALRSTGTIETETLPEMGLTRMLLGVFSSLEEAQAALDTARKAGFNRAFVVRYQDGVRLRRWK